MPARSVSTLLVQARSSCRLVRLLLPGLLAGFSSTAAAQCEISWTFPTAGGPSVRAYSALIYDTDAEQVLLFGGRNRNASFNDLWGWTGSSWTLIDNQASGGPGARGGVAMAYDSARSVAVLFGGGGILTSDTWEWDGASWSQVGTGGPTPRGFTAMVYDEARAECVMFGGWSNGFNYFDDTWGWDGGAWSQLVSSGSTPPPRGFHAMAYDQARGVTVLYGGLRIQGSTTTVYDDTWEWDGDTWTQLAPLDSPGQRAYHAMTYDSSIHRVVLNSGRDANATPLNDSWVWDGTDWKPLPIAFGSPTARQSPGMAYDAHNARHVVFGGNDGVFYLSETWLGEVVGSVPQIISQPVGTTVCSGTSATLSVTATDTLVYEWQIELPDMPGQWIGLGSAPLSLPCGGGVTASTPFESSTDVLIEPCAGVQAYRFRAVLSGNCGSAATDAAEVVVEDCCPGDFNHDGVLDFFDVQAFLAAFAGADAQADWNHDGLWDFFDVQAFLNAFSAGCP